MQDKFHCISNLFMQIPLFPKNKEKHLTSLSICATTFSLVVGLHNFENIPPKLFLQSKTFIHFMNAGNMIISYSSLVHFLWIFIMNF